MNQIKLHPLYFSAEKICQKLNERGFVAYFAGGCVRDALLGRQGHDLDIATNATPDQVIGAFPKTIPVGKAFGVVIVVYEGQQYEVATFRKEGGYQDGRHPELIEFSDVKEDARRRDFTVNGLFYDPISNQVLDFVQGIADIEAKIIRAIGDPRLRFQEDHLRLLRAIRFSAQLGFEIEQRTFQEIQKNAKLIQTVSVERIRQEIEKMIAAPCFQKKIELIVESQLLQNLFPEAHWDPKAWPKELEKQFGQKEGEDFWILFWVWFQRSSGLSGSQVEKKVGEMRFSTAQKKCITQALSWVFVPEMYQNLSLGELVELGFEKGHFKGLKLSRQGPLIFQKAWEILSVMQLQKPEPFVKAADVPELSGQQLGAALKKLYHLQLEGVVKSKPEGLEFYNKKMKTK